MSDRRTCPVTIIVLHTQNKSPVRTIECQAVVFFRRDKQYYYLPFGTYHLRLHPKEKTAGYYARITEARLNLVDFPGTFVN